MLHEDLIFEFKQIESELDIIKILNIILNHSSLDGVQLRAAASSLHSIYNGIEKILTIFLKDKNLVPSASNRWHAEILDTALSNTIISKSLYNSLKDYMAFRHFFRHNYGFMIDSELLKPLLTNIDSVIQDLKNQII